MTDPYYSQSTHPYPDNLPPNTHTLPSMLGGPTPWWLLSLLDERGQCFLPGTLVEKQIPLERQVSLMLFTHHA